MAALKRYLTFPGPAPFIISNQVLVLIIIAKPFYKTKIGYGGFLFRKNREIVRNPGGLESVDRLSVVDALLGCLLESGDLIIRGLEEKSDPVGVVVHGEVSQPGAGVGVDHDLVALLQVDDDGGASHRVLVVVLVVLEIGPRLGV